MKRIGQLLIALGFLEGALVSVLHETEVPWGYLALGLAAGLIGVLLINLGERRTARIVRETGAGISGLEAMLSRVVESLGRLDAEKERVNTYDIRTRIDESVRVELTDFAEAREAISHVYGLQAYADVMSHFAAAERYLNRVWTSSADGYVDEVHAYIPRAHAEFGEALRMLHALRERA